MDWTHPIGVDLARDPVVTEVDGGTLHEWPGCRVFVPGPFGEVEPGSAMPNGCRSHHDAPQDPVERLLADLWPKIERCSTAKELGAAILAADVDPKLKHAVGRAARDRLGKPWTDVTLRHWLKPARHTVIHAEKRRAAVLRASHKWLSLPANRERSRRTHVAWKAENPDYQKAYQNSRRRDDPVFALAHRLRTRLRDAIQAAGSGKSAGTFELVGCTPQELKAHIEAQFVGEMGWHNRDEWHLDHVRPLASYDLTDSEQQRQAMHFSNVAPVWAADNMAKGSLHEGKRHRYRKPE